MPTSPVLSLRPGITLTELANGQAVLEWPGNRIALRQVTPGLLAALRQLAGAGGTEAELSRLVTAADGGAAVTRLFYYLERWRKYRMICYSVPGAQGPLLTLLPLTSLYRFEEREVDPASRFILSRFAYARRDGAAMTLESPLAPGRIYLQGPQAQAVLTALSQPAGASAVAAAAAVPAETAELCLNMLASARLITAVQPDGRTAEEADTALAQWEFQDLLFHARTRGRSDNLNAGTFRFAGKIDPLPAVKPPMSETAIALYRPDLEALKIQDRPFTRVVEERRSIRQYGERPITARQLGEFLYRVARVKGVLTPYPDQMPGYQVSRRPYPSGGASYELELYIAVSSCEGLAAGFYHYDPQGHQLHRLSDLTASVDAMLQMAVAATGEQITPQVLITIAARFPRVTWKYERVAYSLILKDVGVLYQTMYLVATAMDLAPCALGGGDADLFAYAAGTDYYIESSVGDFLLGSKA